MTYATVLVHAEPASVALPRLECAAAIAREFDALLLGLGVDKVQSLEAGDPLGPAEESWLVARRAQVENNLKAAEDAFLKVAGMQRRTWRSVRDAPATALNQAARAADLIVAGGPPLDAGRLYDAADIGALIIGAGKPVLVAPPGGRWSGASSIVVAWKDTREARRAVADALPFLKKAKQVLVVEVCQLELAGDAEIHTSEVAEALGRHGVNAEARVVATAGDQLSEAHVCEQINLQAEARAASLIVSGGYGRCRFTERVFGGVTRGLLRDPERFLLLSH